MTFKFKLLSALREASVTMLAGMLTLVCALAIDPGPASAILAMVLSLALSRSHLDRDRRGRIEAILVLPVVGLIAMAAGFLLHRTPWLGASVFVAGMFLSIWMRRFGPMVQRAGSLIAIPFTALLTTPYIPPTENSLISPPLVPVAVALLAVLWVSLLHVLAFRLGFLKARTLPAVKHPATPTESTLRPIASTRMAIQMAVALGLAFAVGFISFPERWSWIVLTALIVSVGNRGRLDVAYKSVLRVIGAAAGTLIALSIGTQLGSVHDMTSVGLMLGALFIAVWLRPMGYGWWALFITLTLALLQQYTGSSASTLLVPRLEEIIIGAGIGVCAAWFVFPVRSTAVLRLRIGQALAALSEALDPAHPERKADEFLAALAQVELLVPAFRASHLVTRHVGAVQPAEWIDTLLASKGPAMAVIEQRATPGEVRRAVGAARKALREPQEIGAALHAMHKTLSNYNNQNDLSTATSPVRNPRRW